MWCCFGGPQAAPALGSPVSANDQLQPGLRPALSSQHSASLHSPVQAAAYPCSLVQPSATSCSSPKQPDLQEIAVVAGGARGSVGGREPDNGFILVIAGGLEQFAYLQSQRLKSTKSEVAELEVLACLQGQHGSGSGCKTAD